MHKYFNCDVGIKIIILNSWRKRNRSIAKERNVSTEKPWPVVLFYCSSLTKSPLFLHNITAVYNIYLLVSLLAFFMLTWYTMLCLMQSVGPMEWWHSDCGGDRSLQIDFKAKVWQSVRDDVGYRRPRRSLQEIKMLSFETMEKKYFVPWPRKKLIRRSSHV